MNPINVEDEYAIEGRTTRSIELINVQVIADDVGIINRQDGFVTEIVKGSVTRMTLDAYNGDFCFNVKV